ncbi:unnamed protein product [Spirodela intermedia]|uniref:Uncharacterized protein n=1 Tax=Spirodela intermedia TaxID=51605 RepID=A0A7I8ID58_SPIIN|nr:unnamed protein product [Spirodela intermedia]CAA6655325.1 unnamed protein product [Spirodela intermedia]
MVTKRSPTRISDELGSWRQHHRTSTTRRDTLPTHVAQALRLASFSTVILIIFGALSQVRVESPIRRMPVKNMSKIEAM